MRRAQGDARRIPKQRNCFRIYTAAERKGLPHPHKKFTLLSVFAPPKDPLLCQNGNRPHTNAGGFPFPSYKNIYNQTGSIQPFQPQ
jgi:hypothetical protein